MRLRIMISLLQFFTDRPEAVPLENPTAGGIGYFSLSSAQAAKSANNKQTPGYNGNIRVENITSLPSNSAEHPNTKSRENYMVR